MKSDTAIVKNQGLQQKWSFETISVFLNQKPSLQDGFWFLYEAFFGIIKPDMRNLISRLLFVLLLVLFIVFVYQFSDSVQPFYFITRLAERLKGQVLTLSVVVSRVSVAQESFRFYAPGGQLTPSDPWPPAAYDIAENTNITQANFPPFIGGVIRLRMGIKVTGANLPADNRKFKLQFAKLTSGSCSSLTVWNDLGAPNSSTSWRGFDLLATVLTDGAVLPANVLTGVDVRGSYEEINPTPFNPLVLQDHIVEYDWAIQNNISPPDGSQYCFRMVNNNSQVFQSYSRYPQVTLPLPYNAYVSGMVNYATGGQLSLTNTDGSKFFVNLPANYLSSSQFFNVFSSTLSQYLDQVGSQPVGKAAANSSIYRFEAASNGVASHSFNQPVTIKINYTASDIASVEESNLQIYKFNGQSWNAQSTTLDAANKTASTDITSLSSFGLFGNQTTATPTPVSSGGGGGGGGGGGPSYEQPKASVTVSGRAYPSVAISFLRDSQLIAKVRSDASGNFKVSETGLSAGTYNFSLWALDQLNLRSNTYSFALNIVGDSANNILGVLLPPTISVNKETINPGEAIRIFGSSVPDSFVIIEVRSNGNAIKTESKSSGLYSYDLSSSNLARGTHTVKSKSKIASGDESAFSNAVTFGIGVKPSKELLLGDLNQNGKVNIVDFSILAFWYKRPNYPPNFDLNNDGKIDLKDFSIMAYYWTG